jgi:hypothetical protein
MAASTERFSPQKKTAPMQGYQLQNATGIVARENVRSGVERGRLR